MRNLWCIPLLLAVLATAASCSREERTRSSPPAEPRPRREGRATAPCGPDARVTARPALLDAGAAARAPRDAAVDLANRRRPLPDGRHLQEQGRSLLLAIATGNPALARSFFFPRRPFTPLKRSRDPDRYWRILVAAYDNDILRLHRRRRVWAGASFEDLRLGTPPAWIAPGRERNRIGYYKTRDSRLFYRLGGRQRSLRIHTLITWQGRFYVTHLLPKQGR